MAKLAGVPAGSEVDPCCCDCCLYPWPDPDGVAGGPFYPATDLSATLTVVIEGETVTLTKGSGYHYDGTLLGFDVTLDAIVDSWELVVVGAPDFDWSGLCLVGAYGSASQQDLEVEDQFPDTLTVSGDTITRTDLCTWTGPKTGGGTWTLSYGSPTPYKWHLKSTGPTPTSDDKTAPHSSPAGTYGGVTVSGGP